MCMQREREIRKQYFDNQYKDVGYILVISKWLNYICTNGRKLGHLWRLYLEIRVDTKKTSWEKHKHTYTQSSSSQQTLGLQTVIIVLCYSEYSDNSCVSKGNQALWTQRNLLLLILSRQNPSTVFRCIKSHYQFSYLPTTQILLTTNRHF